MEVTDVSRDTMNNEYGRLMRSTVEGDLVFHEGWWLSQGWWLSWRVMVVPSRVTWLLYDWVTGSSWRVIRLAHWGWPFLNWPEGDLDAYGWWPGCPWMMTWLPVDCAWAGCRLRVASLSMKCDLVVHGLWAGCRLRVIWLSNVHEVWPGCPWMVTWLPMDCDLVADRGWPGCPWIELVAH